MTGAGTDRVPLLQLFFVRRWFHMWRLFVITVKPRYLNTDGSFTMANSNSFLSPYEILPTARENKYLGIFLILS